MLRSNSVCSASSGIELDNLTRAIESSIFYRRRPPNVAREEESKCPFCGKVFVTRGFLMRHVEKIHKEEILKKLSHD